MLELGAMTGALGLDETKTLAASYHAVFDSEEGRRVLGDLANFCAANSTTVQLANFCAANSTTVQASERESFVMEGRRQAFLRIAAWLKLDWRDFEDLERDLFDHE